MTNDDKTKNERLQSNINIEAATTLTLSSEKIDKNDYLTDQEILPFD